MRASQSARHKSPQLSPLGSGPARIAVSVASIAVAISICLASWANTERLNAGRVSTPQEQTNLKEARTASVRDASQYPLAELNEAIRDDYSVFSWLPRIDLRVHLFCSGLLDVAPHAHQFHIVAADRSAAKRTTRVQ